jgi:hypothetical protein
MHASVHDRIVVHAAHVGELDRDGEILEVHGADGSPPYIVKWSDTGQQSLYVPGSDAVIRQAS